MNKKEIYEHLAQIYLDASLKHKKKKTRNFSLRYKKPFFIGFLTVLIIAVFIFFKQHNARYLKSEIALIIKPEAEKINFNFHPAKKESYTIDLNKLNLSRFKALGFSIRKTQHQDNLHLRVEFTNTLREKSEIYIQDISGKWKDYKVPFSDFKNIAEWSNMLSLSFIVEEWNVQDKKGVVYIDNIRFLK